MNVSQNMDLQNVTRLSCSMLRDFGRICNVDVTRDIETFVTRVSNEKAYFVTRALLGYGRDLLRAIDCGRCSSGSFRGFKRKRGGGYPIFLQGFLERIFSDGGCVKPRDQVDVDCFKAVYQIALSWYKHEVDCPDAVVREQYSKFVALDGLIGTDHLRDDGSSRRKTIAVLHHASRILRMALSGLDVNEDNFFPRHGSGSTSEGLSSPYTKWEYAYDRLSEDTDLFPWSSPFEKRLWQKKARGIGGRYDIRLDPVATLVDVHKDSRGRRLISKDAVKQMMIQQAMFRVFVQHIENNTYTGGHVNFTEQGINQYLALSSTRIGGYWATIDWKDASDRVSWRDVRSVFPGDVVRHLEKARTRFYTVSGEFRNVADATEGSKRTTAKVPREYLRYRGVKVKPSERRWSETYGVDPQREVREFNKHAPMGSALCFPVMALFIWACAVARICREQVNVEPRIHAEITPAELKYASQFVYVYGDDLIVPSELTQPIIEDLELLGMLCNRDKSFVGAVSGNVFRESCGLDAFNGVDVTPIKFASVFPTSVSDAGSIEAWVEYTNRLAACGLLQAARDAHSIVRTAVGDRLIGFMHNSKSLDAIVFSQLVTDITGFDRMASPVPEWDEDLQIFRREHLVSRTTKSFIKLTPKSESVSLFRWLAEHDAANYAESRMTLREEQNQGEDNSLGVMKEMREMNLRNALPEDTGGRSIIERKKSGFGWMEDEPMSNRLVVEKIWFPTEANC